MRRELKLIAAVIRDFMGPEYDYDDDREHDRQRDFDGRVDVIPVSDPNAATMAQRVVQYQAALQLAQQAPQLYDMGKLHRGMLEVLNIQDADEIIKLPGDLKPMDPVTENMAILKQEPVKAFQYQDHEAHIAVHMAAMQDPKIQQVVGQSPFAAAIASAASAHITEHVAMAYRVEIQKQLGVELPGMDEELPEDVEREVSRLAAAAAEKLLGKNQAEAAQQAAQQAEQTKAAEKRGGGLGDEAYGHVVHQEVRRDASIADEDGVVAVPADGAGGRAGGAVDAGTVKRPKGDRRGRDCDCARSRERPHFHSPHPDDSLQTPPTQHSQTKPRITSVNVVLT
jgi:hypothetical protein